MRLTGGSFKVTVDYFTRLPLTPALSRVERGSVRVLPRGEGVIRASFSAA
jgi:hypothetical protein